MIDVGRLGVDGPAQVADAMEPEFQVAQVLQPLHPVPRPGMRREVVEGVPVRVEDIGVSVLVQVDQPHAAGAVVLVVGDEDLPRLETAFPVPLEHVDFFPLLADQHDDVQVAVAVQVGNRRVDRPGAALEDVTPEAPAAQILDPSRLAVVVAELGHGQVEVAVAVEVAGADVGNPRHALDHHVHSELHPTRVLQNHHRADPVVVGKEHPQYGDHQVQISVTVEVDRLHVGGRDQVGSANGLRENALRVLANPRHGIGVAIAYDHVEQAVLVEVHRLDVRDFRRLRERLSDRPRDEEIDLLPLGKRGG